MSPELEAICVRATEREPDKRFATARALYDAIEAYLDGHRDVEVRKEMADAHARAADVAAGRALAPGPEAQRARADAMREVSRALALDPTHRGAIGAMARLLLSPPAELPDDARAELVGLVPAGYVFRDGMMCIVPRFVDLAPSTTWIVLLVVSVACVVVPSWSIARVRASLSDAERRLFLHAWHLRQLVPGEALESVEMPKVRIDASAGRAARCSARRSAASGNRRRAWRGLHARGGRLCALGRAKR